VTKNKNFFEFQLKCAVGVDCEAAVLLSFSRNICYSRYSVGEAFHLVVIISRNLLC